MTWKCCQDFSPSIVLNKIDLNILVLFSLVFADKCFECLQRNVSVVIRLIVPVEVLWHLTGSLDLCSQWAWSRVLCLMPLILMVALMHSLSISLKPSWKFWLWSTSITPPPPPKNKISIVWSSRKWRQTICHMRCVLTLPWNVYLQVLNQQCSLIKKKNVQQAWGAIELFVPRPGT